MQIYHCCSQMVNANGGIKTYVNSLLNYQSSEIDNHATAFSKHSSQNNFNLFHFHTPDLLTEFDNKSPAVYSVHDHKPYCPSGSKYLSNRKSCCNRKMSYLGCTLGKLIDGCGSKKPRKIIQSLKESHRQLENIKKSRIPVIANSEFVREHLIINGLPPQQVLTVHLGIQNLQVKDCPLTKDVHQNQRILFAGRIVPHKGLDWLLNALSITESNIHLDIAGEGWGRSSLEKLANQIGVQDRVTWHGWCSRDQLDKLYEQCHALIVPSLWPEPAGLVILEAYAHYRPVIASAVGGIPEYLHDQETGLLVPANNIQTLATAITELSTNYTKAKYLGEQGYKLLTEKFTLDLHVQRLQKVYEQTINNFKDKTPK